MHAKQRLYAVLVLSIAVQISAFDWKVCDSTSGLQKLKSVSLSPEPVPAGTTAKFTIEGTSAVELDESQLKLTVYYLHLPVYHRTIERHEHIAKGDFSSSFSEPFPAYTPAGSYRVRIESSTTDNQLLSCLDVEFKVTWPIFQRAKPLT